MEHIWVFRDFILLEFGNHQLSKYLEWVWCSKPKTKSIPKQFVDFTPPPFYFSKIPHHLNEIDVTHENTLYIVLQRLVG
jgi:hypothetical protein